MCNNRNNAFINNVQAYELEKPENITYIRWNTEKRGSITIKSYYEFNSEVRGLGDKIYSYDNKEVPEDKLLGTGMNFNYYNRENARVYIAVKGEIHKWRWESEFNRFICL